MVSEAHIKGWIGVDLDGTLAQYDGWRGIEHIGAPVPAMLARVKAWLAAGRNVKIFTARIFGRPAEQEIVVRVIGDWLVRHGLPTLDVTCIKDMAMVELWDDRCVQVEANTGKRMDGKDG